MNLHEKFINRIPFIVTPYNPHTDPPIKKSKFLVPRDMPIGHFLHTLRTYIPKLSSEHAIFLFYKNKIVKTTCLASEIDSGTNRDEVLHLCYHLENCFGSPLIATVLF